MAISKGNISKIHVAKAQLGMDDDTYRLFLQRVAGVSSSKELTKHQLGRVFAEFRRLGFIEKPKDKAKGKPHNFESLPSYITKIEALLASMGLPWSYVNAMAKRMYNIEQIAWIKKPYQLEAILAGLYNKQQLDGLKAHATELMNTENIGEVDQKAVFKLIKGTYKRRKELLQALIKRLEFGHILGLDCITKYLEAN